MQGSYRQNSWHSEVRFVEEGCLAGRSKGTGGGRTAKSAHCCHQQSAVEQPNFAAVLAWNTARTRLTNKPDEAVKHRAQMKSRRRVTELQVKRSLMRAVFGGVTHRRALSPDSVLFWAKVGPLGTSSVWLGILGSITRYRSYTEDDKDMDKPATTTTGLRLLFLFPSMTGINHQLRAICLRRRGTPHILHLLLSEFPPAARSRASSVMINVTSIQPYVASWFTPQLKACITSIPAGTVEKQSSCQKTCVILSPTRSPTHSTSQLQ
ncbi:hypothetical protein PAAG_00780 [Paracoccidioides lutzii Pb01]|uniref:Uncharacterized protein n=1 Tax=Paracoccidioides lutzii (strain ATCC MYA-826 / Pb01) TaxID=502779 RepID=C1GQI5_PARBA|nr:hypothetical protein PAAG_00780 [Paracoccidioides lutzii Pb01]EEH37859.2 hypothetical protein PAAG_00780 [Paracoccidioides lutzii Pb01]